MSNAQSLARITDEDFAVAMAEFQSTSTVLDTSIKGKGNQVKAFVRTASLECKTYIASGTGAAAKVAREELAYSAFSSMAQQALSGNYTAIVEALTIRLAEPLVCRNRKEWDGIGYVIAQRIYALESAGKTTFTKSGTPSGKYGQLLDTQRFYNNIQLAVDAAIQQRKERKLTAVNA